MKLKAASVLTSVIAIAFFAALVGKANAETKMDDTVDVLFKQAGAMQVVGALPDLSGSDGKPIVWSTKSTEVAGVRSVTAFTSSNLTAEQCEAINKGNIKSSGGALIDLPGLFKKAGSVVGLNDTKPTDIVCNSDDGGYRMVVKVK